MNYTSAGSKKYPEDMTSNKRPHIMCPECFKGNVIMNFTQKEGTCDNCETEFKLNGLTLKYK
jgi:uncharacterized protein (DUF983 family)